MGTDSYISASGAAVQLRDLDVVANNIANTSTPGFKRTHSVFKAVLEGHLRDASGDKTPGAAGRAFVSTDLIGIDFARGSVEHTGSRLHAMIDGPGFFEVETEQGIRYTRAGNFRVNTQRQLSTADGLVVMGEGGPITVNDPNSKIDPTGSVIDFAGNIVGRLKVVDFAKNQELETIGLNLYRPTDAAEPFPVEEPVFIPESIEGSNVEASRELAEMVMIQRAYETNMHAMETDDQTTERLIEGIR